MKATRKVSNRQMEDNQKKLQHIKEVRSVVLKALNIFEYLNARKLLNRKTEPISKC